MTTDNVFLLLVWLSAFCGFLIAGELVYRGYRRIRYSARKRRVTR